MHGAFTHIVGSVDVGAGSDELHSNVSVIPATRDHQSRHTVLKGRDSVVIINSRASSRRGESEREAP